MDIDGVWREPERWPEDYPPLAGWVRNPAGGWLPPDGNPNGPTRWNRLPDDADPLSLVPDLPENSESKQARSDTRAMLTATGVLGAIALLVAGVMALISQAGADPEPEPPPSSDLIFAAETAEVLAGQRGIAAAEQPAIARTDLAALRTQVTSPEDAPAFDVADWQVVEEGCLSTDEQLLIARSRVPVTYVDQLECVLDTGEWIDRAHGNTIDRVVDAAVVSFVPYEIAHGSGAMEWSEETKHAFASDLEHPATRQVVAVGFGHNPRAQDPSAWKPAAQSQWCAYAVDWIAVKTRWDLAVTPQERSALASMLDTCGDPSSAGADPATVVLNDVKPPTISLSRS